MPNYSNIKYYSLLLPALALMLAVGGPALAIDIMPAMDVKDETLLSAEFGDTHPPIKVTSDKSELIRLDEKAGSVIIGNPDHLSVLADSATTLVLIPKRPGATYLTILNNGGDVIMQRHVLVGTPKERYIRVRRSCAGEEDCSPTQVYFCPDTCHEVSVAEEQDAENDAVSEPTEDNVAQISGGNPAASEDENPPPPTAQ